MNKKTLNNLYMEVFQYLTNLDNNTYFTYFFGFIVLFFILKNFFYLTNQTFFSLIIAVGILGIYYYYKTNLLKGNLNHIKRYEKVLNLKYFSYLRRYLDVVLIYYDMISFGKIDKYNFTDSMKSSDRFFRYYSYLKKGNIYYKQYIDLAKQERDNALNYLSTITKSLTANLGIIDDKTGINQIEQDKLLVGVRRLKLALDQYVFEMMNIGRIQFETQPITNTSYPVEYDANDPEPRDPENNESTFQLYYGFVLP